MKVSSARIPRSPSLIVGFVIAALLSWIALCILLATANVVLVAGAASLSEGATPIQRLASTAPGLSRIAPLSRFATSVPVDATLRTCAKAGPWLFPVSAPCAVAQTASTGAATLAVAGDVWDDVMDKPLVEAGRINVVALRSLEQGSDRLALRAGDFAQSAEALARWPMPSSWRDGILTLVDEVDRGAAAAKRLPTLTRLLNGKAPVRFFIGLTTQSETRAGGGLLGMYAIVEVTGGEVRIAKLGSNLELPPTRRVPDGLGEGFYDLFGRDNPEWQNLNLAPDGSTSGRAWLSAWETSTGQRLNGAISLDTRALGQLSSAADVSIRDSTGRLLSEAEEITNYISLGVYSEFPRDDLARKQYQSEIFSQVIDELLGRVGSVEVLEAFWGAMRAESSWVYFADPTLQQLSDQLGISGSWRDLDPKEIRVRFNNLSGNKSDFFLKAESIVKRMPSESVVRIRLSMDSLLDSVEAPIVTNRLDELAKTGRGSLLQVLLSVGAALRVDDVRVDGQPVWYSLASLNGRQTISTIVNVTTKKSATLAVRLYGPRPEIADILRGSLVRPQTPSPGETFSP